MSGFTNRSIEGDGIIDNLYYYLWCKDDFGNGIQLCLPDTVIYHHNQPSVWYFTDKKGNILKKSKKNVSNNKIEQEFNKKGIGFDIIAYYISSDINDNTATIEYFDKNGLQNFLFQREKDEHGVLQRFIEPKGASNTIIRALWSPKICLLERRINIHKLHDKKYNLYERAVTFDGPDTHSYSDPVRGSILPGDIQYLIEKIVDHIAEVSFRKYHIKRFAINLKIDAEDRIWFLWSSSIRLENKNNNIHRNISTATINPTIMTYNNNNNNDNIDSNSNINNKNDKKDQNNTMAPFTTNASIHVPTFLSLKNTLQHKSTSELNKSLICCSCSKTIHIFDAKEIPYKSIVTHFEQILYYLFNKKKININNNHFFTNDHNKTIQDVVWPPNEKIIEKAGGVGFKIMKYLDKSVSRIVHITENDIIIPPVIQYQHPHLNPQDYIRYKKDPIFLYKTARVCDECYLVYADYSTFTLELNSVHPSAPLLLQSKSKNDINPDNISYIKFLEKKIKQEKKLELEKKIQQDKKSDLLHKQLNHYYLNNNNKIDTSYCSALLLPCPTLPKRLNSNIFNEINQVLQDTNDYTIHKNQESSISSVSLSKEIHKLEPLYHSINSERNISTPFGINDRNINININLRNMMDPKNISSLKNLPPITFDQEKVRNKINPYSIKQKLILPEDSNLTLHKTKKSSPKQNDKLLKKNSILDAPSQSAIEHREFLLKSLMDVRKQLDNTESLKSMINDETTMEGMRRREES